MIYKVRVKCFGERPNFPKKAKPVECEMSCLVDEPTSEQATVAGVAYVQCIAPVDVRWHEFDWREVSPVSLPILVKSI